MTEVKMHKQLVEMPHGIPMILKLAEEADDT